MQELFEGLFRETRQAFFFARFFMDRL